MPILYYSKRDQICFKSLNDLVEISSSSYILRTVNLVLVFLKCGRSYSFVMSKVYKVTHFKHGKPTKTTIFINMGNPTKPLFL